MAERYDPANPIAQAQGIAGVLEKQGVFAPTPLTREAILKQREMVSGLPGLGPVDYSAENKEATDFAKLQFALSLMGRGFSAMGATPQSGEGALGALGRTLIAPVASDISAIAGPLMQQRQAQRAAERANEARLSQAALTMQQQVNTRQDASRDQQLALARSLAERDYVPTKGLQRTKPGGKPEDFMGFFYKDKLNGLPVYAIYGADGKEERVPGEQLSEYRKPATVTALKATGASVESRVIQFPVRGKDGKITGWKDVNVNQVRQIIPQTGDDGPRMQYGAEVTPIGTTIPMTVLGPGNKPRNVVEGVDFIGTDKANFDKPAVDKLYIRPDLDNAELLKAQALLKSSDLKRGEGVQRWVFRSQVDPEQSKIWYDVKGNRADLTPDLANKYLTSVKPEDAIPAGGKRVGTTTSNFSVVDKAGKKSTVSAILMEMPDGDFKWKQIGEDGKFLSDAYQKNAWESNKDDKVWQQLRPVLTDDFKSQVKLRNANPGIEAKLLNQNLTQTEIIRLATLTGDARKTALNDLITKRMRDLGDTAAENPVTVPESVTKLDPRVDALTRLPAAGGGSSVINPRILNPWKSPNNKSIQLGTGSHPGFTKQISPEDLAAAQKNYPAIRKAYMEIFPGREMGDAEEKVMLFTGLWKNLPGVAAPGSGVRTFDDAEIKKIFNESMGLYNKASPEYKPATEIKIGRDKFLQDALDENLEAMRDNVIMLRFREVGGAFFADGDWLAEMRGGALGELFENWTGTDNVERVMPSDRWAAISRPDKLLNKKDLALKRQAFEWMQKNTGRDAGIGLTEFEKAAEYLAALSRYKIRAFQMIDDSRPSDRDIELLLGAFVTGGESETKAFTKLADLQRRHAGALSANINKGLQGKAVFSPTFLATLDHTSRALSRASVFETDPRYMGRGKETSRLFKESASVIGNAAKSVSGRILPGHRGGAISPLSQATDEEATSNLYRMVSTAALREYPNLPPAEAVKKFVDMGMHLQRYLGVFGRGAKQSTPNVVYDGETIIVPGR